MTSVEVDRDDLKRLVRASRGAVRKLKIEYDAGLLDEVPSKLEMWSEGSMLRDALEPFRSIEVDSMREDGWM